MWLVYSARITVLLSKIAFLIGSPTITLSVYLFRILKSDYFSSDLPVSICLYILAHSCSHEHVGFLHERAAQGEEPTLCSPIAGVILYPMAYFSPR